MHELTDVSSLAKGIEDDLSALASPLMTRLQSVDELIAERLDDLATLRKARLQIVHALRPLVHDEAIPIEPGRNSKPGPKGPTGRQKVKPGRNLHTRVSEATVDKALDWLRQNQDGNEFGTRTIQEAIEMSGATATAIVARLLERQQIRLHRVSSDEPGRPRYYKVVSE